MDRKSIQLTRKSGTIKRKSSSLGAPDFDSMFDPTGLPALPEEQITDIEQSVNQEVSDMMALIRENRKNNAERFRDVESGEFWFCVCFQSRNQKETFIKNLHDKFGGDPEGFGDKYISGLELADLLGIPVEPIILEVKKSRLAPKNLRKVEVI